MQKLLVARLALGALLGVGGPVQSQSNSNAGRTLTNEQWREDLVSAEASMRRTHKNLFHTVSEQALHAAFQRLAAEIPSLNDDEITVRLMQIGAMVRDGHSAIDVAFRRGATHVPLRVSRFPEGIFIRSAPAPYASAVGARIVRIGAVPWDVVLARIDSLVSCDPGNDGQRLSWPPALHLTDPLVLHGLGVLPSHDRVIYTLEKDSKQFELSLMPTLPGDSLFGFAAPADWVEARHAQGVQPLRHPWSDAIALAYVPDARAWYLQFNAVAPPTSSTMAAFASRLTRAMATRPADRLVIDVRRNGGGDNTLLRPLLLSIIRSPFNHRGALYVLIGPTTFSAAQNFVNRIESYTDAIFVGQPTSNNVNFYGDPAGTELPNSHLDVEMAHLWWQDEDPRDTRTATFPEIAIPSGSFADYVAGTDAALDYALHAPAPPRFEDVMTTASRAGYDRAQAAYHAYVQDPRRQFVVAGLERKLNTLGYQMLGARDADAAVVLFRVNAAAHPESSNVFDSLGDGYDTVGDAADAVTAYRRAVQLDPANSHARDAVRRLAASR